MPDEKGEFADFRHNVLEVMRDLVFIVGSVDIFQKVTDRDPPSFPNYCYYYYYYYYYYY